MYIAFQGLKKFVTNITKDRILLLSFLIVSILTITNIVNRILFRIEPVQYTFFSYDKILHLLTSILIVRVLYWIYKQRYEDKVEISDESSRTGPNFQKKIIFKASLIALVLYGLIWEPFELFTFIIQDSSKEQLYQEFFDIPLDWIYDIAGIFTSYLLGYD
ncbi:MAG: hypothetical protein ACW964_01400 [Candidatus Hodarchaeales archaeon]